jgi:geranylgeranyl pyrophosphate synthase
MSVSTHFAGSVGAYSLADSISEIERLMEELVSDSTPSALEPLDVVQAALKHLTSGGHRVRAGLGLDAGLRLGLSHFDSVVVGAAAELLHNASLVHDDLHDGALLRRGTPTVFAACGPDVAVLTGDLLLSSAYAAIARFSRPAIVAEMIRIIHRRTAQVIHGQCGDLSARKTPVTELARYEAIVARKSGALLSLPLELALWGAGSRDSFGLAQEAAESFGIGYQIIDDLEDAGSDGPLSLNIVNVLKTGHTPAEAVRFARQIGSRHLHFAIAAAERLPNGSGELLGRLARVMSERL